MTEEILYPDIPRKFRICEACMWRDGFRFLSRCMKCNNSTRDLWEPLVPEGSIRVIDEEPA